MDSINAAIARLKFLAQLIILDVKIPDASLLPKDVLFENLIRYRIFIGDVWYWYGSISSFPLLKRTEDLCLYYKSSEFGWGGFLVICS